MIFIEGLFLYYCPFLFEVFLFCGRGGLCVREEVGGVVKVICKRRSGGCC